MTVPTRQARTVLVMYYTRGVYPLRDTIHTHLYCWKRYSSHRVLYVNIALGFPAAFISRLDIDVIIFHTLFLGMRWTREIFEKYVGRCRILAERDCVKIAIPQDEFLNTDLLNRFIAEFGITHVLTMAGAADIDKIYDQVDRSRVRFKQVLAGYIDPASLERIRNKRAVPTMDRAVDIGYRAWKAQYWLGEHGTHKVRIAQAVGPLAEELGLKCDISLEEDDVLAGDEWFEFLLGCRATLGAEGGARVLDRDGQIKQCVEDYLRQHRDAGLCEVESHCFPGHDGEIDLTVITPRHFEACMTGTLQLLVEGRYNDVLSPWRHYVPIKRDYSNLSEALGVLKDAELVEHIVSTSTREIAQSGKWTYPAFVRDIEQSAMETTLGTVPRARSMHRLACCALGLLDAIGWWFIRFERRVLDRGARRSLPKLVYNLLVRIPGRF